MIKKKDKICVCIKNFWNKKDNYKWYLMVGSWGRLEVRSAPFSYLVRSWGNTCGWKMRQPSFKTGTITSNQGLVRRWGRLVLRPSRSQYGAQHIYCSISTILEMLAEWSTSGKTRSGTWLSSEVNWQPLDHHYKVLPTVLSHNLVVCVNHEGLCKYTLYWFQKWTRSNMWSGAWNKRKFTSEISCATDSCLAWLIEH